MLVSEAFSSGKPTFSFEFFPPKTDAGLSKLFSTIEYLVELKPAFVSVTYGAGGSTRGKTVEIAARIKRETGIEPVAHLTCRGHKRKEVDTILSQLSDLGIYNLLALRGDPPVTGLDIKGDFEHADELVDFIRSHGKFCIGVAGHPEGHVENPDRNDDLNRLAHKVSRGADYVTTQLFFDNTHYFSFVQQLRTLGVSVPILPGIMPVTSFSQIKKVSSMCGSTIPPELLKRLERFEGDEASIMAIGIEWALRQCQELLSCGVPGIHFYTMNRSLATRVVCVGLLRG